ncbi:uncharacterized protein LOC143888424 isoform X2 [Tasmannia lanceolata]|uniref:uncharacterized protein LOC143888424 isoform X2 n=1 Tax=Tasmannia lanceolata TaxID=3420 RepID=UPI004064C42C
MSQTARQRVVVIEDASRDISLSALKWALHGLSLKPGDKLILLGILHQVNTTSMFPLKGAKTLLGYKSKVDPSSILGGSQKITNEAVAKKTEEYENNMELLQIRKLYKMHKIDFDVWTVLASSPKVIAQEAVKKLQATWIILDRQMKKEKKYFLEKLSCGISRMKRNNSVEKLRGPKTSENNTMNNDVSWSSFVTYDEMLPGTPDDLFSLEFSPKKCRSPTKKSIGEESRTDSEKGPPWNSSRIPLFSKSISSDTSLNTDSSPNRRNHDASSSSSFHEVKHSPLPLQEEENYITTNRNTSDDGSPKTTFKNQKIGREEDEILNQNAGQRQRGRNDDQEFLMFGQAQLENSVCLDCENGRPMSGSVREFKYDELQAATDNFSIKNFLSEGGFGSVYKGRLKNGKKIAVKQHKDASMQGEKEFKSEVRVLSTAIHENVVKLLGSCSEGNHRLLVYEFVCNGSLDKHLSEHSPRPLSWTDRMKLAVGAAKGLNYLHEKNIIHRDMRPNNILVTHDYEPLLGDFGLAKTQQEGLDHSSDTRVVGTFGYLAPEYAESGKVSKKTDVYSFGMVLLQLITGRMTTDKTIGEKSLVGWARPLLKERKYHDLIDSKIVDSHDVHQLFWMVRVAEKCLSKDPDKRLPMEKVVNILECVKDGRPVNWIEDFSSAHSDSASTMPETSKSKGENETLAKERLRTDISPISSKTIRSEIFSSASWTKTLSIRSTRTSTSSESSSPAARKSSRKSSKKKRAKSGSQSQIPYGEMLS